MLEQVNEILDKAYIGSMVLAYFDKTQKIWAVKQNQTKTVLPTKCDLNPHGPRISVTK